MTKSRGILRKRQWARPQLYVLHRLYADTPTQQIAEALGGSPAWVYHKAAKLGLKKSAEYRASHWGFRPGSTVGAAYRFKKGLRPHNTGIKGWQSGGRSRDTRFKKGQRGITWVPIGTHRVASGEGYLERKVTEHRKGGLNWTAVHRLVWIEHHGPIPAKHVVAFKEGLHTTDLKLITIDRLQLLSYQQNMARNSYHNYPKPIAQLIQLRAALNRQIRKRERARHEDKDRRPA